MPRKARALHPDGGFYHVGNRGTAKMPIFLDDADRLYFEHLIRIANLRYPFELLNYVLMGNHYHLLVHTNRQAPLDKIMKIIDQGFAVHFNERYGRTGAFWQDRYWHRPVISETQLHSVGFYIESNPLRAGLVANPEDYAWSSFAELAGMRKKLQSLLACEHEYRLSPRDYRAGFKEWQARREEYERRLFEARIIGHGRGGRIIGQNRSVQTQKASPGSGPEAVKILLF